MDIDKKIAEMKAELNHFLAIQFGNPSNSLSIANAKRLKDLNEFEREHGRIESASAPSGFRIL